MNPISTNFFKMSTQHQLSIISKAAEDDLAKLSIPLVCKLWHLILNNTKDHFSSLPNEDHILIFTLATEGKAKELSSIALVCKKWSELQAVNSLWKRGLNRCIEIYKYEIDHSSVENHKEQIKIFAKTRLNDFKEPLNVCALKYEISKKQLQDASISEVKYVLAIMDHTVFFKKMILSGNLELLARLILCRPKFDANEITHFLMYTQINSRADSKFIFNLIIKLRYNISESCILKLCTKGPGFMSQFCANLVLLGYCNGIKIPDLIASGINLKTAEINNPAISVLWDTMPLFHESYKTGKFLPTIEINERPSFSDETLKKHIRMVAFTENELKVYILDLLTKAGLNLDFFCPAYGEFREGTVLFRLRQQADLLPKGNSLAKALAEFDQITLIIANLRNNI